MDNVDVFIGRLSPTIGPKKIQLPSGIECFVFLAKREQDELPEPVLCFCRGDKRLTWLDKEEVQEFAKLVPRLQSYFSLWEQLTDQVHKRTLDPQETKVETAMNPESAQPTSMGYF